MSAAIEIMDYDPQWPRQFAEIAARVRQALPSHLLVAVEHIGSTSVPGLAAKPVIDLDVVIPSADDMPAVIEALATLGYGHEGDLGIAGREAFHWPPGMPRHHLYACPAESEELRRHLAFRDFLRAHPDEARRYEILKRDLADRFRDNRAAYTDGKAEYILTVLGKVGLS